MSRIWKMGRNLFSSLAIKDNLKVAYLEKNSNNPNIYLVTVSGSMEVSSLCYCMLHICGRNLSWELRAACCFCCILHIAHAPWASLSVVFEPANRVNTVKDTLQFFLTPILSLIFYSISMKFSLFRTSLHLNKCRIANLEK